MTDPKVNHATIVVERRLKASPERVFQAWTTERGEWEVPNDDWVLAEHRDDVRVDGEQYSRFGPRGDERLEARGRYLVVERNRLLILAGVMHDKGAPMTATQTTIELLPDGRGTRMILTDQSAFFGWESPDDRRSGWEITARRLEAHLARTPHPAS